MKISLKRLVQSIAAAGIVVGVAIVGSVNVSAQQVAAGAYAQQLQGTWVLVSQYVDQEGQRVEPFGANPRGMMVLTPDGHFSMILMTQTLPKFVSNNRVKGTAEEYRAVVEGSIANFGTYSILSEKDHLVSLKMMASTFPNWDGQDQKRVMTVAGDEMKVTSPTAAIGGTAYVVWKRAK